MGVIGGIDANAGEEQIRSCLFILGVTQRVPGVLAVQQRWYYADSSLKSYRGRATPADERVRGGDGRGTHCAQQRAHAPAAAYGGAPTRCRRADGADAGLSR